ncbi:MAG: exodeoxyribonuclease V subunit gamma, partial [Deltaproteobacteria bacterium]|nr:exodeoxyribonuclease V subunit gamma [Deltaproteobacteria bacterium]
MSRLKIFTSNRLEVLSQQLANTVREPVLAPLEPEVIIVQSRGMERWISMELAAHNGVSANCKFPFPNVFLEDVFKRIIPNLPEESVFEPGVLTFRIIKILPRLLSRPEFKNLKTYLSDDTNKLKLYQLSSKIADVFDQYLVFRPEMIFDWEAGKGGDRDENRWQAYLWRELTRGAGMPHRARLRKDLFDGIANRSISTDDLPPRVSVFGISYLPPFHLQVFAAISRLIQVNLFILNPCKEYWFDIASDREIRKIEKHYATKKMAAENLHLERGNRLLASMGNLGRDFMSLLAEFNSDVYEQFEDLACDTMLACVQSDILSLWEREGTGDVKQVKGENRKATPLSQPLTESDNSIQFHACHSPLREMEVLYDNLLAIFEEDPTLFPRDIIVMTPDIELYAPYVHIVFGTPEDAALMIPYSIADQSIKKESRLAAGFLSLLDLKASRFGAAQILNLLELPGVKEKFGLTGSDVHRVEGWIRDTNIRWGIDAASRRQLGLPGFSQNTWSAGINRLLLGYAMAGNDRELFNGILPYDNLEGAGVQALGKFLEFLDQILLLRKKFEKPRSLNKWNSILLSALDQLFRQDDENEPEIQFLRRAIDDLTQ